MKKIIRWPGLIVFIIIVGAGSALWILLADKIVESLIEKSGTEANGALVELDSADVTLLPLGVRLNRLQVTDPEQPMKNALEIAQCAFSLDSWSALQRKIIINQMTVEGIALGTPREKSGAIPKQAVHIDEKKSADDGAQAAPEKKKSCAAMSMPSFALPDIKNVLAQENLPALKAVNDLSTKITEKKQAWQTKLTQLPDEQKFQEYKKEVDALKKKGDKNFGAVLGKGKEALALKKKIEKDVDQLKTASSELKSDLSTIQSEINNVQKGVEDDINGLTQKYGLGAGGLENLSQTIFGSQFCGWIKKGMAWYNKLKPYIKTSGDQSAKPDNTSNDKEDTKNDTPKRGKGKDIHFKETHPKPDFWVKTTTASLILDAGELKGDVQDVTSDPQLVGKPTVVNFAGDAMEKYKSIKIQGILDHVNPKRKKNSLQVQVDDYQVQDMDISTEASFPLQLHKANADLALNMALSDDIVDATIDLSLGQSDFKTVSNQDLNEITRAIVGAFDKLSDVKLTAKIKGPIEDYTIDLSSNIDRQLKSAVSSMVSGKINTWKKQLRQKVLSQIQPGMDKNRDQAQSMGDFGKSISDRLAVGNDLIKKLKEKNKLF